MLLFSINQVLLNKQKFAKMKKPGICRLQVVTIDTDTPGKTRRAWTTKDFIYMTEGKTQTVANQTAATRTTCVELCASLAGFLSIRNTLKGLRHSEQGQGGIQVSQTSDRVF